MVSALDSGSSVQVRFLAGDICVVFLGKTLYSHRAILCPGVQMGAEGSPAMDSMSLPQSRRE